MARFFSIKELMALQSRVDYTTNPKEYNVFTEHEFNADVVYINGDVNILNVEPHGERFVYNLLSKELKNFRHEFVSSLSRGETDVKISDIPGAEGLTGDFLNLTPDFYDTDTNSVLELGTSASMYKESLEREYKTKFVKYNEFLDSVGVARYYVLIVSPTSVCTNLELTQDVVDELCLRCRIGIYVEAQVVKQSGEDIYRVDEQPYSRVARLVFKDIDMKGEIPDYVKAVALEDMTEEEVNDAHTIMKNCMDSTENIKISNFSVVQEALDSLDKESDRSSEKRVSNFPLLLPERCDLLDDWAMPDPDWTQDSGIPSYLVYFLDGATSSPDFYEQNYDEDIAIGEAMGEVEFVKHRNRKRKIFKCKMSHEAKIDLAMTGIGGKKYQDEPSVKSKKDESHRGISPYVDYSDIEDFIFGPVLTERIEDTELPNSKFIEMIEMSKQIIDEKGVGDIKALEMFKNLIFPSEIVQFCDFISALCSELAVNSGTFVKEDEYIYRRIPGYRAGLIIKPTRSHVFFCVLSPSEHCKVLDTGRIGPEIWNDSGIFISDVCSLNESTIEHYIKSGPYFSAIMSHLFSHFCMSIESLDFRRLLHNVDYNPQFWQTIKTILLCYLNNKLELEELITAQRYFFMSIMDEFAPDPCKFAGRFPAVLRSRLSAYILQRTVQLIKYYQETKVRRRLSGKDGMGSETLEYTNLRSVFCTGNLSLQQKIGEFYFGYVISKNRSSNKSGASKSFAICQKIYKEELLYREQLDKGLYPIDDIFSPEPHVSSKPLLKYYLHSFDSIIRKKVGGDYKSILERELLNRISKVGFSDLATLKASAKPHVSKLKAKQNSSTREALDALREDNEEEFLRRPKMIEAITWLVSDYKEIHGEISHSAELIKYCLEELEEKDCFESDLFPKSQHGGDREIHVLEVRARVVQYFIELISKFICGWFRSETITHPEFKDKFVKEHYTNSLVSYDKFLTLCKSADAKTWCQRHNGDRFMAMLLKLTPSLFHGFISRTLSLWQKKVISLPMDLVSIFLANKSTPSSNKLFKKMIRDFYSGEGAFLGKMSHKILIKSGMFQGILHYTSSLYHTMIQEVTKQHVSAMIEKTTNLKPIITIAQGSDDSAEMISLPRGDDDKSTLKMMYRYMCFKERVSEFLSVYNSPEKSVMGIMNVIEYNSEWFLKTKVVKPTFRWVSACLEVNLVETFLERMQIFSNVLSQVVEGGGFTLEASLIQISQAWMHYKLLGIDNNPLGEKFGTELCDYPDPNLGFMPLEPELVSGVAGFDFALYLHCKRLEHNYCFISPEALADPMFYNEEAPSNKVRQEQACARLVFGNLELWKKIVEGLELEDFGEIMERVEKDPELVFGKHVQWNEDKTSIALKIFSKGVRTSLSSNKPLIRMMIAGAYILQRPCLQQYGTSERKSLYLILRERANTYLRSKPNYRHIFLLSQEYDKMYDFVQETTKSSVLYPMDLSRRSKVRLEVFSSRAFGEFEVMNLCKRKWFNRNQAVPVGTTYFNALWDNLKLRCPFIKDTLDLTKKKLGMNTLQVKIFIEGLNTKKRYIKLADTTAKGVNVYSSLSRICWPGLKLRSENEERVSNDSSTLLSNIYSVLSYPFSSEISSGIIRSTLEESTLLKNDWSSLSQRLQQLKIFRDVIAGKPKAIVAEELGFIRNGTVGFFSTDQEYDKKTKRYSGKGEWKGHVNTIPCKIELEDDKCVKITIRSLNDFKVTAKVLRQLIKEFRTEGVANCLPSPNKIYLTDAGLFTSIYNGLFKLVPIYVDNEMMDIHLTKVMKSDWKIVTDGMKIRLISDSRLKGNKKAKYSTLLTFRSLYSDWDPTTSYTSDFGRVHECYHYNREASRIDIRDEFNRIISQCQGGLPEALEKVKKTGSFGYFNMHRLQVFLRTLMSLSRETTGREGKASQMLLELKQGIKSKDEHEEVDPEEVTRFIRFLNASAFEAREDFFRRDNPMMSMIGEFGDVGNEDFDEEIFKKEEEFLKGLEDEENLEHHKNLTGVIPTDDEINKTLRMLEETDLSYEEAEELYEIMNLGMPIKSRTFDACRREILALASSKDFTVEQLLKIKDITSPDIEGIILSIISGANRLSESGMISVKFSDYSVLSSQVSEFHDSVTSRLEETMQRIKEIIPLREGPIRTALSERYRMLEAASSLRRSSFGPEIALRDVISKIPVDSFLSSMFYTVVKLNKKIDTDFVEKEEIQTFMRIELRKFIYDSFKDDLISEEDKSRYLHCTKVQLVSETLIDLLSIFMRCSISFVSEDDILYQHVANDFEGNFITRIVNFDVISYKSKLT